MHRSTLNAATAVLALIALLGFASGPAIAQSEDDEAIRKVDKRIVKTRIHCEGENCSESDTSVVFIDDDGNVKTLPGHDVTWIGEDGDPRVHVMKRLHGPFGGTFLGIQMTELTPELRAHFGVPEDAGVMVSKIVDDSPAQRAGLRVGDVITLVDDESVASGGELAHAIAGRDDGETVALEVWRDGKAQRLSATLEEREGNRFEFHPRIHMRHGAGPMRHVEILCDGEDCGPGRHGGLDYDCGGAEECQVEVRCDDGDCTCTVNGENADCAEIGVGE